MKGSHSAIEEISRLRLYQQSQNSSKSWAWGSIVLFIALTFAPLPIIFESYIFILQIIIFCVAVLSIGFVILSGKQRTILSRKQMKLLGLSESSITYTDDLTKVDRSPALANNRLPEDTTNRRFPVRQPAINNFNSRLGPSGIVGEIKKIVEEISPIYGHKRVITSPKAYAIPNECPQTDSKNYELDVNKLAESSWLEINRDINKSLHTPATPGLGFTPSPLGGQSNSVGSFSGFPSQNQNGSEPRSVYNPYAPKQAYVTDWITYNVSPMSDVISPGLYRRVSRRRGTQNGPKHGLGGVKVIATGALVSLGLSDISDIWIDNLKRLLGKHLHQSLSSFDSTINTILQQLQQRGMSEQIRGARNLLEYKTEKESFGPGTSLGLQDLLQHIKTNINPKLVDDYRSLESLLLLPVGPNNPSFNPVTDTAIKNTLSNASGNSSSNSNSNSDGHLTFLRMQGALLRARILNNAPDKCLRISWPSGPTPTTSPLNARYEYGSHSGIGETSAPTSLSDADLVISIFLHYCDMKASAGSSHSFSAAHFLQDIGDVAGIVATQGVPLVGILRQENATLPGSPGGNISPGAGINLGGKILSGGKGIGLVVKPCFSVFSTDNKFTEILTIEDGRQNSFLSVIVFLLESLRATMRGYNSSRAGDGQNGVYVSSVINDLCLEVFQMRDINAVLDYFTNLGMDFDK